MHLRYWRSCSKYSSIYPTTLQTLKKAHPALGYALVKLSSKLCTEIIEEDILSWNAQVIEHIHN